MNTKNKNAIILLSGGLDSYIALDIASKQYEIKKALFFNYGQKAYFDELEASKNIAKKYRLDIEIIQLSYLNKICSNALVDENNDDLDNFDEIWIPNRNGLFINIAACYCDKYDIQNIILGLNFEEAQNFSDNSTKFIKAINNSLYYSTQIHAKVIAPCAKMTKVDIINYAIDNNIPLNEIKSCYDKSNNSNKKHCAKCMSCKLLYNAIIKSKKPELVKEIF